jgi:hypothetical protein
MLEAGVPGLMHPIAATNWSLGGSLFTFAFPMALFILAALVIYRLLWWPHRIPGHSDLVPSHAGPPEAGTAHAMAAAAGMTTAAGAGAQPLPTEPHGATEVAEPAGAETTGPDGGTDTAGPGAAAGPAGPGRPAGADGPDPTAQPDRPGPEGTE